MQIDLNDILHRRTYTGRRGRPVGSGKHWIPDVYNICKLLAANDGMTVANAVRQTVTDPKDSNAVDRLTRKVRQNPRMLVDAKERREKAVQRVLKGMTGCTVTMMCAMPLRRTEFDILLMCKFPLSGEVMDDPRIQKAADEIWRRVRPSSLMLAAMGYEG